MANLFLIWFDQVASHNLCLKRLSCDVNCKCLERILQQCEANKFDTIENEVTASILRYYNKIIKYEVIKPQRRSLRAPVILIAAEETRITKILQARSDNQQSVIDTIETVSFMTWCQWSIDVFLISLPYSCKMPTNRKVNFCLFVFPNHVNSYPSEKFLDGDKNSRKRVYEHLTDPFGSPMCRHR